MTATVLTYPLLRFSSHTVKPQPRHVEVNKNLPTGGFYTGQDFILFLLDDGPVAVSRRCTHLGCRVNYRKELEVIECPCHQSRFTVHGTRISGPAKKDLSSFPVQIQTNEAGQRTGFIVTL